MKTEDKNIHEKHRERMKSLFLKNGLDAFSEVEKLEFLLFFSVPFKDTNPLAHKLLDEFKSLSGVLEASYDSLIAVEGVGHHTAIFLSALHEYITQYYRGKSNTTILDSSVKTKQFCKDLFVAQKTESFLIICLGNDNSVINTKFITSGSANSVNVEIKDISKFAFNNNCERIMVAHNHPTGKAIPSDNDISYTASIILGLSLNDIDLVDHIIVGTDNVYSMLDAHIILDLKADMFNKHVYKYPTLRSSLSPYKLDDSPFLKK